MSDTPEIHIGESIPEGTRPEDLPFYGAQIAMQDVVRVLSNYDIEGRPALSHELVMKSLAMGIALMITGQPEDRTPRDVRLDAEHWGKAIAQYARALHEAGPEFARTTLKLLGIEQVTTPVN